MAHMKIIHTTELFDDWFAGLRDKLAEKRIQARIRRAKLGNFGDCAPVGEGVSEMRIHYGPGYRIYFAQRGMEIVILLAVAINRLRRKTFKPRWNWRGNCRGQ